MKFTVDGQEVTPRQFIEKTYLQIDFPFLFGKKEQYKFKPFAGNKIYWLTGTKLTKIFTNDWYYAELSDREAKNIYMVNLAHNNLCLYEKTKDFLKEAEDHQAVNGRKDLEFPDSQKEVVKVGNLSVSLEGWGFDTRVICDATSVPQSTKDVCNLIREKVDEVILKDKISGVKHNSEKLPMSRLLEQFPQALQAVVLSSFYGAKKYNETDKWDNFSKVEGSYKTYLDAYLRHALDYEGVDEDSKLPHIFLMTWNSMAALQLFCRDKKINMQEYSKNFIKNLQDKK